MKIQQGIVIFCALNFIPDFFAINSNKHTNGLLFLLNYMESIASLPSRVNWKTCALFVRQTTCVTLMPSAFKKKEVPDLSNKPSAGVFAFGENKF